MERTWLVFLKAVFGIAMEPGELALYRKCTARSLPPQGGAKESYAIVGRRGDKSRMVSFAAVYLATFHDFKMHLTPGETAMVLIRARDRDQARVVFNYIGGIINNLGALKQMVVNADYRAIRGITVVCCICEILVQNADLDFFCPSLRKTESVLASVRNFQKKR